MDIEIIAKTRRISMKVLVTGVSGQLGHDVMNELAKRGYTGVGSDIAEKYSGADDGTAVVNMEYVQMDITDEKAVEDIITEVNPDVIVHCAAWTAVDMAEDDDKVEKVRAVNAGGTRNIARVAKYISVQIMCLMARVISHGSLTARIISRLMCMDRLSLRENLRFLSF